MSRKGGTEHTAIVVIRLSWRGYILTNYNNINAIMQPPPSCGMATVRVNGSSRHGFRVGGIKNNGKWHSEEIHWRMCRMKS